MARQHRPTMPTRTYEELQEEEAHKYREAAEQQPPGSMARELLLRRAQKIEAASHFNQRLKIQRSGGERDSIRPR